MVIKKQTKENATKTEILHFRGFRVTKLQKYINSKNYIIQKKIIT